MSLIKFNVTISATRAVQSLQQIVFTVLGTAHERCYEFGSIRRAFPHRHRRALLWRSRNAYRSESVSGRPCRYSEPPVCLWQWRAAHQQLRRRQMFRHRTRPCVRGLLSGRRKSLTSAWRHSTSSTRKTPGHLRPAFNLRGEAVAAGAAAAELAGRVEPAVAEAAAAEAAVAAVVCHGAPAAGARLAQFPIALTDAGRHGRA